MIGRLQGEEWKFIQKYLKEKISCGVGKTEEISHQRRMGWCEIRTRRRCCAKFAQGEGVVRNLHMEKVLCEIRTCLEQMSSEGHIFLISAPNRTRFKALDS